MPKNIWFRSPGQEAALRIARAIKGRGSIAKFARAAGVEPGTARDWIRDPKRMRLEGAVDMLVAAGVQEDEIAKLLMRR